MESSRILLDTQVVVAAGLSGLEAFPARVRKLVADPDIERVVSAISIMEIAIKSSVNRLVMERSSVCQLLADLKTSVIPFTSTHSMRMFDLPLHHTDPFDRMLIATAIVERLPLVGGGEHFPAYKAQGLSVIWK